MSSFVFPQHASRKPRPPPLVFQPTLDSRAVSPDFDSRSISSISSSPASSDEGTPVDIGSKRQSTLVGFGRKQHFHRHSISVPPVDIKKHEYRRSLPGPISLPVYNHNRRLSLAPAYESSSNNILGASLPKVYANTTIRRGQKPLLLPEQVKAKNRTSFTGRAKRNLLLRLSALAASAPVEFVLNRLAIAHRLRPAQQQQVPVDNGDVVEKALVKKESDGAAEPRRGLAKRLKKILFVYRFLHALAKF